MNDGRSLEQALEVFGVTQEEVDEFRCTNAGLCGLDKDRISRLLYIQLASAMKHRVINTFSVTDEIRALEKGARSLTANENQFKHSPLKGLWKAHYFDPQFLMQNIKNELASKNRRRVARREAERSAGNNFSRDDMSAHLAHEMSFGAYDRRASRRKLTGEWIIFAKYYDKNYYLALSRHSNDQQTDREIHDFLLSACREEFLWLVDQLS